MDIVKYTKNLGSTYPFIPTNPNTPLSKNKKGKKMHF